MTGTLGDVVLSRRRGASLVLTLNRPDKRNALCPELYAALTREIDRALAEPGIANIVLEGANGFFCSGGDLDALADRAALPLREREARIEDLHRTVRRLRACAKPVIAAIEGGAAGAGVSIALAADLIVAAEDSFIALSYVKAGLVPDGGATVSLLRALPPQMVAEMTLLGGRVPAARLADFGVINRVVPPGQALEAALLLGADLAAGARSAQAAILRLLDRASDVSFEAQLEREKHAMASALGGPDAKEGIAAFRQRRVPAFPAMVGPAPAVEPLVETAFTRLFGTRLPIVAGGPAWAADADYVGAAARAGIIGFLPAGRFPEPDSLRAEIRRCRRLAGDRPFGVDVSMLPKLVTETEAADIVRLVADEGVRFMETSGSSREAHLPIARDAGTRVLHKVASLGHAVEAQESGVDAVAIVGADRSGRAGLDIIDDIVDAGLAGSRLRIPWLIGGGVSTGAQVAAILAMGGAGAVVGTRFLAADEVRAHPDRGVLPIGTRAAGPQADVDAVRSTARAMARDTMRELRELEASRADVTIDDLMRLIVGRIGHEAHESGQIGRDALPADRGPVAVARTQPLAAIVEEMGADLMDALRRMGRLVA